MPPLALVHPEYLTHPVGHGCAQCDAIRHAGPQLAAPAWPHLIPEPEDAPLPETPRLARAKTATRKRAARIALARHERLKAALAGRKIPRVSKQVGPREVVRVLNAFSPGVDWAARTPGAM